MNKDEALKKPCEYCGQDLPLGVDKPTRQVRSHHFSHCTARPEPEQEPVQEQEPVCPDCTAKVLYECVFCSSNNYPPKEQPEQWVGLTDEDIHSLHGYYEDKIIYQLIKAAEALLKEKNT